METKSRGQLKSETPAASPSFDDLAAQQGVRPVRDFDQLLGAPCPGDESAEEFSKLLRNWRSEGTPAASSQ